jgi:hypothetical protein
MRTLVVMAVLAAMFLSTAPRALAAADPEGPRNEQVMPAQLGSTPTATVPAVMLPDAPAAMRDRPNVDVN